MTPEMLLEAPLWTSNQLLVTLETTPKTQGLVKCQKHICFPLKHMFILGFEGMLEALPAQDPPLGVWVGSPQGMVSGKMCPLPHLAMQLSQCRCVEWTFFISLLPEATALFCHMCGLALGK